MASHDILQRRHAPFVRNVEQIGLGHALEVLGGEVKQRSGAAGAKAELAGIFLRKRNELRHVIYRQLRRGHHDHMASGNKADRREVAHEVIRRIVGLGRKHGKAARRQQQRVTVRRGVDDRPDRVEIICTRSRLDNDGLTEDFAQLRSDEACNCIRTAPRRNADDDRDRAAWSELRKCTGGAQHGQCGHANRHHPDTPGCLLHCLLPDFSLLYLYKV